MYQTYAATFIVAERASRRPPSALARIAAVVYGVRL